MKREYPYHPIIGVGAIIIKGEKVLLARRGREPDYGKWSIPGGAVKLGETLKEAVKREVREEVSLAIRVGEVVEVLERIFHDPDGKVQYHYVRGRETLERRLGGQMGSPIGDSPSAPSRQDKKGHSKGL